MKNKFIMIIFATALPLMVMNPAAAVEKPSTTKSASAATEEKSVNITDTKPANVLRPALEPSGVTENSDLDSSVEVTRKFVVEKNGVKTFDESAAKKAGASKFLLEVGQNFNEMSDHANSTDELMYHGNWCGPGRSGPGAPIDTMDAICKKHDECYGARGYFACSCDIAMVQDIRNNRGKFKGVKENAMAVSAATYFSNAMCNPLK